MAFTDDRKPNTWGTDRVFPRHDHWRCKTTDHQGRRCLGAASHITHNEARLLQGEAGGAPDRHEVACGVCPRCDRAHTVEDRNRVVADGWQDEQRMRVDAIWSDPAPHLLARDPLQVQRLAAEQVAAAALAKVQAKYPDTWRHELMVNAVKMAALVGKHAGFAPAPERPTVETERDDYPPEWVEQVQAQHPDDWESRVADHKRLLADGWRVPGSDDED